jgi:hypothetical protein
MTCGLQPEAMSRLVSTFLDTGELTPTHRMCKSGPSAR